MLFFGKKKGETAPKGTAPKLNDFSYIQDIKHTPRGAWHRYDILLAARGYGWDTAVDWAEYVRSADLDKLSTIVTADIAGGKETEHKDEYQKYLGSLKRLPSLSHEYASLGVGGISRTLREPMKVTWFNQTRTLRLLTTVGDGPTIRNYAETLVRRKFGTKDAMKPARPIPKD